MAIRTSPSPVQDLPTVAPDPLQVASSGLSRDPAPRDTGQRFGPWLPNVQDARGSTYTGPMVYGSGYIFPARDRWAEVPARLLPCEIVRYCVFCASPVVVEYDSDDATGDRVRCESCETGRIAEIQARADDLGIDYESARCDYDCLAERVSAGLCDGLGTCIGTIPGRDGETGYFPCHGCAACAENDEDEALARER